MARALCAVALGALLLLGPPSTAAEEAPEYYTFLGNNICPLAVGDAPADPPLYEGWQEDGQFEASASSYITANDLLLVNSEDNPSSLHFNGFAGWYALDASEPAAFVKFSMQCDGNCPSFEIQYSDDINPNYDPAANGQAQGATDGKHWVRAAQTSAATTNTVEISWPSVGCHRFWRYLIKPAHWQSGVWYYNFRFFGEVSVGAVSWADAQSACLRLGLELATVHTAAENDEITSLVNAGAGSSAWVGGSDQDEEGAWVWSDGSPFDYGTVFHEVPWGPSEPNGNAGESCLQFYQSGTWNDVRCTTELPVVCMRAFQTPTVDSSFPAFSVVKGADMQIINQNNQWVEIGDWTAAGYTSLMRGFEFDDVAGRFTLHLDGVYFATTQITLFEANTGNVAVAIITNQNYHDVWNNGCIGKTTIVKSADILPPRSY